MTIDGYLHELRRLYIKAEIKKKKLDEAEAIVESPRSSLNLGDGTPIQRGHSNSVENKMMKYVEASDEWRKAVKERDDFKTALYDNIYQLYYWEGLVIERLYVYGAYDEPRDEVTEVYDILHTYNERKVRLKIKEAKQHLRQILIDQGMDIE